jgi:hypothetical protein
LPYRVDNPPPEVGTATRYDPVACRVVHITMRAGTRRRSRWFAAAVALGLLLWLAPSPLPWRSPLQRATSGTARELGLSIDVGTNGEVAGPVRTGPPAAPTPTPTPTPTANSPVPAAFHGQWRGIGINRLTGDTFSTAIAFYADVPGTVVAIADFPTYKCRERWQLERPATARAALLRATLTAGSCVPRPLRVRVRLVDARHLLVQWHLTDAAGTLESEARVAKV